MPFGLEVLGDILGITAVHVSRTLKELRDANLIELAHRRLTVPNVQALRNYSEFDPAYLPLPAESTQCRRSRTKAKISNSDKATLVIIEAAL